MEITKNNPMAKKAKKAANPSTANQSEIAQFDGLGLAWWDETGPMWPLHELNPVRLSYIKEVVSAHFHCQAGRRPLRGLKILDIGCGGGLVTEPLCRLGADVTGLDAGAENIRIAKDHARQQDLDINYVCSTAEQLAARGKKYDVVTALEIIEHVDHPDVFIEACCKLLKPDGLLILSTLNRTAKSFALGIVAAEYILRWLPQGTHNWKKFLKPSEMARQLDTNGFQVNDIRGLVYHPVSRRFSLSKSDLDVNYLMTAKPGKG